MLINLKDPNGHYITEQYSSVILMLTNACLPIALFFSPLISYYVTAELDRGIEYNMIVIYGIRKEKVRIYKLVYSLIYPLISSAIVTIFAYIKYSNYLINSPLDIEIFVLAFVATLIYTLIITLIGAIVGILGKSASFAITSSIIFAIFTSIIPLPIDYRLQYIISPLYILLRMNIYLGQIFESLIQSTRDKIITQEDFINSLRNATYPDIIYLPYAVIISVFLFILLYYSSKSIETKRSLE
jgi:hypothetical protein